MIPLNKPFKFSLVLFGIAVYLSRPITADDSLTYEKDVRPILKSNCFQCHGEEETEAELDLRLRRLIVSGGESGPAIAPGNPGESLLLDRIESGEMPPGKKRLAKQDIEKVRQWIATGATTAREEPEEVDQSPFTLEEESFWSFQPIQRPAVPEVREVANPIDAFLLTRLRENELTFSDPAPKHTLLRRAYFDLHGLPPTSDEVAEFLENDRPEAFEQIVEQLLASPHYGERWGRHWLDIAGYADSEGYTDQDIERNWAWKYRDYVIDSLNQNKPLNQFIVEQIAGDELIQLPYTNLNFQQQKKLVATGFLRMAPDGTGSGGIDQNIARNAVISSTIKIVSTSLLGLTVGCAECHNHRYDPILQTDYYRLRAIFEPGFNIANWRNPNARLISLYSDENRKQASEIETSAKAIEKDREQQQEKFIRETFEKQLAKLNEEIRPAIKEAYDTPEKDRSEQQKKILAENPSVNVSAGSLYLYDPKAAETLKKLAAEAAKVRATKPEEQFIRALTEIPGKVPDTYLFKRGDYQQRGEKLLPSGLSIVSQTGNSTGTIEPNDKALPTTGRRLAFANTITAGNHPLVARVLANRIWMHHFGQGIVGTPADFGFLGERPTHPELLDWLASELIDSGWDLKHLHRLMMNSQAYSQSSVRHEKGDNIDPDNRLLWKANVRRLDAESLRDAILSAGGKLNQKMSGKPVPLREDEVGQIVIGKENKDGENKPGAEIPLNGEEYRRSIYITVRRTKPMDMLATFDAARPEPNCTARDSSTVSPQSLLMLNSRFIEKHSLLFAQRILREAGPESVAQIRLAWKLAYGTEISSDQLQQAITFVNLQVEAIQSNLESTEPIQKNAKATERPAAELAMANFCQALFSSNRFLYVD